MKNGTCERIVIVGGGFAGLSIAVRLVQSGLPVTLLEVGELGFEASTRNQGWLHSGAYFAREHPKLARMCYESLLQTIEFCPQAIEPACPEMFYIFSRLETQRLPWTRAWEEASIPYEPIPCDEACRELPGIDQTRIQHVYRLPDRSFRPHVLIETLAATARALGAEIRPHVAVTGLLHNDNHVYGVRTGTGEEIHACRVVLATGAMVSGGWSSALAPRVGEQTNYTRVVLKTHLVSVQPELGGTPFCVLDDDGFNHLPHWRTSVFGNGHWPVVQNPAHRAVDPQAIDRLWQQVRMFYPDFDRDQCESVREWSGTTMQMLHVDQVDPGRAPLPTIVDHSRESPHYQHLWSVFPGRATLWAHLAEQFREVLLNDLEGRVSQSALPPWSLKPR